MRTAIDSNILSSIFSREPTAESVAWHLEGASQEGALIVSPFVFAELHAHPSRTAQTLRAFLEDTGIVIDLNPEERLWSIAGARFAGYAARRRAATDEGPR